MTVEYLKQGHPALQPDLSLTTQTVQEMLDRMETEGKAQLEPTPRSSIPGTLKVLLSVRPKSRPPKGHSLRL